jgi:hypothetical protein
MTWTCKEDCGNCCGPIPLAEELVIRNLKKIQRKIIKQVPISKTESIYETVDCVCIFLTPNKQCAIYEDRPNICMIYGTDPKLPCPYIKPNGNPRSPAKTKHMQRQIDRDVTDKLKHMQKFKY